MDDNRIKRLAITLAVAIAIILLAKYMLTKTYSNLNKVAAIKKPVVIYKQTLPASAPAAATDMQTVPATSNLPASAVNTTPN